MNGTTDGRFRPGLVSLVIPAKNERDAIGQTLKSLPLETLHAAGFDTELVLLDGNSHDGTAEIAARHGAVVLSDPEPGKGAAFRNGRRFLRGDYVVMMDADGTYAADAIPRAVNRLAWDEADVVMGERHTMPGAMSAANRFGNRLLSLEASLLYGRRCRDVCTGLWAFRAEALRSLPLTSRGFELEAELFARSSRMGLRIVSVPVDYLQRTGHTKLSPARDGLRIGWSLLRNRFGALDDKDPTRDDDGPRPYGTGPSWPPFENGARPGTNGDGRSHIAKPADRPHEGRRRRSRGAAPGRRIDRQRDAPMATEVR